MDIRSRSPRQRNRGRMNWLDIVVLLILVGMAALESSRGFGQALLDALLLYGALWLADTCLPLLAPSLHLVAAPAANRGLAYGLLLAGFGSLAFLIGLHLHRQTMLDAGVCERMLGLAAGAAVGIIFAHSFVRLVALNLPGGTEASLIAGSFLGNEMLSFTTYHAFIAALTGDAPLHRTLPT